LYLLRENFLDKLPIKHVQTYAGQFVSYVQSVYSNFYASILTSQDIDDETYKRLGEVAKEFDALFVAPEFTS
ncbi:MAG: hypothetical protein RQ760_22495, partial [Sedimentisphaerales bacterium]|nr:hypothetical protein [Sedimentisphaerales bacterium]